MSRPKKKAGTERGNGSNYKALSDDKNEKCTIIKSDGLTDEYTLMLELGMLYQGRGNVASATRCFDKAEQLR
jgi:outer membrane receptor for ferrienterochelin and colicin